MTGSVELGQWQFLFAVWATSQSAYLGHRTSFGETASGGVMASLAAD
jgi:hypothetical protein